MSNITECVLYLSYDDSDDENPDSPGLVRRLMKPIPDDSHIGTRDQAFWMLNVGDAGGIKPMSGAVLAAGFSYLDIDALVSWLQGMPWSDDPEIGTTGVLVYRADHAAWDREGPASVLHGVVRFGGARDATPAGAALPTRRAGGKWTGRQVIPREVREHVAGGDAVLEENALDGCRVVLADDGYVVVDGSAVFEWRSWSDVDWLLCVTVNTVAVELSERNQ